MGPTKKPWEVDLEDDEIDDEFEDDEFEDEDDEGLFEEALSTTCVGIVISLAALARFLFLMLK